jgi:L,D-transpeptidase YcbB
VQPLTLNVVLELRMPRFKKYFLPLLTAAVLSTGCDFLTRPPKDVIAESIREELAAEKPPEYVTEGKRRSPRIWKQVQSFYEERGFLPVWTGHEALSVQDVVEYICNADQEGLNPNNYSLTSLAALYETGYEQGEPDREVRAGKMAQADIAVTYALMTYKSHLMNGYARPHWKVHKDRTDIEELLHRTGPTGRLNDALRELRPGHDQYEKMREALTRYREIKAQGGWPELQVQTATSTDIAARLAQTGEFDRSPEKASEKEIIEALTAYQVRNGLPKTGKLDRATVAALNVPVEARIRQIEINLERWRWLPRDLGSRYILVNVASFELEAVENGKTVLTMPVVVGKQYQPTPLFSDELSYLVINPSWNIPESIAQEEILPAVLNDSNYLSRNEMEVVAANGEVVDAGSIDWEDLEPEAFEYRFRQKPGDGNSLGRLKFMFPNEFNVYLHDTPATHLFERRKRDFSHGCVRVGKPVELAEWVLEGQDDWDQQKITATIGGGEETTVKLSETIPVYLLYWTAWVDDDGAVFFREDVYGEDRRLLRAIPPQTLNIDGPKEICANVLGS